MKTKMQPLILSLKPCYADLVFKKLKTVELRRRIVQHIEQCEVFVYVSSPIMALRGGFRVGNFWTGTPKEIWNMVEDIAQVNKRDFDTYFEGQTVAYAFEITEVWEFQKLVPLNDLREQFLNFVVPQSWRYVRKGELQFFRQIKEQIKEISEHSIKKTQLTHNQYIPINH